MKLLKKVSRLLWSAVGFIAGVFLDSLEENSSQKDSELDQIYSKDPYHREFTPGNIWED